MDIKIGVFAGIVKGNKEDTLFLLSRSCSNFRRELWMKSMHYNVKAVPDTVLGKTCIKKVFGGLQFAHCVYIKKPISKNLKC